MTEEWRDIEGRPYQVSSLGRIRNAAKRVLIPRVHTNGYLRISFGRGDEEYIHRVVCTAFHGPAPDGYHADHIDGTRNNNREDNLRWLSRADNLASRKIALGNQYCDAVLTPELVRKIRAAPYYRGFDPDMAKELNVSITTIRFARIGRTWRHVL